MIEKDFLNQIITDTKVKISEEFDRNFERKGFFDKKWPANKFINRRGSMMNRSGKLRRGNIATTSANGISWKNSMPQAQLMNEGGKIKVTEKMKRFFWAMYYKTSNIKKGEKNRVKKMSIEAEQWKTLALIKVGNEITIEQRQFIGDHPQVHKFVKEIINYNFQELEHSWAIKNGFK